MLNGEKVSVILPTYNEKDSIRDCIEEFFGTGVVNEVIVVNNNAAAGTEAKVAKTKARQVFETKQGYGHAIQRGLAEATGDLLVLCEPDGTFRPRDILRLLAYADEFDVVFGTRTTRELIGERANMGLFLRWGNWAVAKLFMILFNTTSRSDVGCTFRCIRRHVYEAIRPHFSIGTSHFGFEMMILIALKPVRAIEISINYRQRVGKSSVTGSFEKAFTLGMTMIGFGLRHYLLYSLLGLSIPKSEREETDIGRLRKAA